MKSVNNSPIFDNCPQFYPGRKVTEIQQVLLWKECLATPDIPSPEILKRILRIDPSFSITVRHINRFREKWGLSRRPGRPCSPRTIGENESKAEVMKFTSHVSFVGLHVFDKWIEEDGLFSRVISCLMQGAEVYRSENPDESFPLLYHREITLILRFKALFYAPLFDIKKLTEYDRKEHALRSVIGRSYQSSTLTQYLGDLERINAGNFLMPSLLPTVPGEICYIDGHMTAFWTTKSMHKGKITMSGRIMSGSQAVVAHNEKGQALYAEYYPPDIRLTQTVLNYCEKIVHLTGIEVFVIDREVNSEEIAAEFESREWGLLCMLDKNQYKDLSDWEAALIGNLEDRSKVYKGQRKGERKEKDKRIFVIVEREGELLVYWGTSEVEKVINPSDWPGVYSDRNEIQEKRFKEMRSHGALDVNYGIKKIVGPDRHRERKKEVLKQKLLKKSEKTEKKEGKVRLQEEKVKESKEKGHGERLAQRQKCLGAMQEDLKKIKEDKAKIERKIEELGQPGEREDRDFRKQKIMTFRTLLLENALMTFFMTLLGKTDLKIGLESFIELFFKRNGACLETDSSIIYWFNTRGLSSFYKEQLKKITEGINALNLNGGDGKSLQLRTREGPA